jgi:hypothetical protein
VYYDKGHLLHGKEEQEDPYDLQALRQTRLSRPRQGMRSLRIRQDIQDKVIQIPEQVPNRQRQQEEVVLFLPAAVHSCLCVLSFEYKKLRF